MLRCVLLDDELLGLTYLKRLCEQIDDLEVVKSYTDPELLIKEIDHLEVDLCILDIEMPNLNGIQVANLIHDKWIIFVTAYKEYAVDAFDLAAVDYLQKPLKRERLERAIERVRQRQKEHVSMATKTYLNWNSEKGKTVLQTDDIAFIKTAPLDSRDKVVVLKNRSEVLLKNINFQKLKELLPIHDFVQINKREIISVDIVSYFTSDVVTSKLVDDQQNSLVFTLSEVYREDFYQKVSTWLQYFTVSLQIETLAGQTQ